MTGDTTARNRRQPDALDKFVGVALRILGPDFGGALVDVIPAAADYIERFGDDRLAHWFADIQMDLSSHSCINDEWCGVCDQQAQQERDRAGGGQQ